MITEKHFCVLKDFCSSMMLSLAWPKRWSDMVSLWNRASRAWAARRVHGLPGMRLACIIMYIISLCSSFRRCSCAKVMGNVFSAKVNDSIIIRVSSRLAGEDMSISLAK